MSAELDLDLEPIKARLAATTPGTWHWQDEVGDIPYTQARWVNPDAPLVPDSNDGSLGVTGLYVDVPEHVTTYIAEPVLVANDEDIPADPNDPTEIDWSKWRGLIHASNLAD